ncbi:monofunctional biosynthetic peptidoglycan transglycosylase [Thiorhodococcus mannitoliphagus]|uniref:Biosynthetic peptidoglycan transglycosylase n=1 Tax=Thiorhodococcus mannitoliphagus TaxID=329406 RepID=A0A6P1DWL5_9GAMM|nr:monofunctional biosynthetic peptidoglycan transglycosylase [Thiorhodococcus mannitoliphagus]NEX21840.1 monofunctional biosynthetic peptidoglycan transglycosylase [Thiorhodococcus mannitoliphagus]
MTEIGVSAQRQGSAPPLSTCSADREGEGAAQEPLPPETSVEVVDRDAVGATPARTLSWALVRSRALRWASALLVILVLASAALVGVIRWVNPPASAFMAQHALNVWRLHQKPPYYRHQWIDWDRIPDTIRLAAIAGEDQRFPSHQGFDLIEIRHAVAGYLRGGPLRGASTITQQTAKNLFLWPGSGWWRKLAEGWLTLLMETLWSKERILEVYLNIAQFSPSTYGIEASAQRYFHHSASDLTLEEAALLIAVLPAPGNYSLDHPSERLRRRAAWIRDQSSRLGGTRYLSRL